MRVKNRSSKTTVFRKAVGHLHFRRTPLDVPLLLFFLTAIVGTWLAYSVRLALFKFWVIVAAIGLYYLVTAVSRRYAHWLAALCGPLLVFLAFYFVTASWWHRALAFAGGFFQPFFLILSMRRFWPLLTPHPNVIAGLIAMFFPFALAFAVYARRENQRGLFLGTVGCLFVAGLGLFYMRSLGALLALAGGLVVWGMWVVATNYAASLHLSRRLAYLLLLIIGGITLINVISLILRLSLPGSTSLQERVLLVAGNWQLVQDFSLTGSGLGTFPALYSEYIQIVPNYFVSYGNSYFDVLLELGVLGAVFLFMIWAGAGWLLLKALRRNLARPFPERGHLYWLRWATLSSIIIVLIHGLVDDTLFGGLASPFLFFTPAVAVLVSRKPAKHPQPIAGRVSRRTMFGFLAFLVVLSGFLFFYRQKLLADWYANQAALEMDHLLLVGWPHDEWRQIQGFGPDMQAVTAKFEQALALDAQNRTAQQRLGTLAYFDRDFETAVFHLENAYQLDNDHRGVKKMLGYSYIWQGRPEQAIQLLQDIPEASREIGEYASWWQRLNRRDLAEKAEQMLALVKAHKVD